MIRENAWKEMIVAKLEMVHGGTEEKQRKPLE
jgi:hypothetical protein